MDVNEAVDYFIKNAQRAQAVFLASIERPRLYDEISMVFGMPKATFYNKDFHEIFSQTGFVKVEYFGRTPYIYAVFEEPFFVYFEKTSLISPPGLGKDIFIELFKDKPVLKEIFDSREFRNFWNVKTLQTLDRNYLKDPAYTALLFHVFIQFFTTLYAVREEFKLSFKEAKEKAYVSIVFLLNVYNYPISRKFLERAEEYLTENMKVFEKIKETHFFKKSLDVAIKVNELVKGGKITLLELFNLWKKSPEELERI